MRYDYLQCHDEGWAGEVEKGYGAGVEPEDEQSLRELKGELDMQGFHAGEIVWVICKENPESPYVAKYLEIRSAMLIDRKVRYFFDEIDGPIPASRVCATLAQASRVRKRLNKKTTR